MWTVGRQAVSATARATVLFPDAGGPVSSSREPGAAGTCETIMDAIIGKRSPKKQSGVSLPRQPPDRAQLSARTPRLGDVGRRRPWRWRCRTTTLPVTMPSNEMVVLLVELGKENIHYV